MAPLISIVIPTANRPQYLPRAVESALEGLDAGDVEVIVVPNGHDNSWQETLLPYRDNHSVRVIPVGEANANVARNKGMAEARGEYVRFLDDDDFLYPEQALKQYELITSSEADVVSGSVRLIDENGRGLEVWRQPDTDDLCAAVLGPFRNCLPTAHVYRRSCLGSAQWNPATKVRQDVEWLLDLCASRELGWHKTGDVVGVWQQHPKQRVSSGIHINEISKITVPMLLKTHDTLNMMNRLTAPRRQAAAVALWGLTAKAFLFDPIYWSRVARTAMNIDPKARHPYVEYNYPVIRGLSPLLMQWLLLPKRWTLYQVRKFTDRHHMPKIK
jgi:glycosyltransferase involved in cell wall biosynthesis